MKPMLLAFIALAIITFGADKALDMIGFSAADQTSGEAVRLD